MFGFQFLLIESRPQFLKRKSAGLRRNKAAEEVLQAVVFESIEREIHGRLKPVDETGHNGGTVTVVDIHDRHIGGTTIQHAQKRGHSVETGTVADTGWNRNHRYGHEPTDNA